MNLIEFESAFKKGLGRCIPLLNKNPDLDVIFNNSSNFIDNNNIATLDIRVYFTIFDMVFAIIMSLYKRGKYVRQKKSKSR